MRIFTRNKSKFLSILLTFSLLIISGSSYASSDRPLFPGTNGFSFLAEFKAMQSYFKTLLHFETPPSFCHVEQNIIQNDSLGMSRFYNKLTELRQGRTNRVTIVQIGDSHLQSGFIPGEVRSGIQGFFGDAGRGFVFPYRAVGTGEAYDLSIRSQGWKKGDSSSRTYTVKKGDTKSGIAHRFHRSIKSLNRMNPGLAKKKYLKPGDNIVVGISYRALPPGFSGFTLKTSTNANLLNIRIRPGSSTSRSFNKLSLLLDSTDSKLSISVTDTSGNPLTRMTIDSLPADMNPVPLVWSTPTSAVQVRVTGMSGQAPHVLLYGILLEKTNPGVVYHSIGLNGAGFDRYNKNPRFFTQLHDLNPDLVIVSLGTNDAMGNFRRDVCEKSINVFVGELRKTVPGTDIMMTSPPDSYKSSRKGKIANAAVPKVRDIIRSISLKNGFAYWNLYDIMGGGGSMKRWVSGGLAQYDHKHFNAAGYREQGYLLRDSILQGYASYVERLD